MKIDMVTITPNCSNGLEVKNNENEEQFLSILNTKIESIDIDETIDQETNMDDELAAFISSLLGSFSNDDLLKLKEIVSNINMENKVGTVDEMSIFNNGQTTETLKNINLTSEEIELLTQQLKNIIKDHPNISGKENKSIKQDGINIDFKALNKNNIAEVINKVIEKNFNKETTLSKESILNKESVDIIMNSKERIKPKIEDSFSNSMKYIEYNHTSTLDKDRNILLEISNPNNKKNVFNESSKNIKAGTNNIENNEFSILNPSTFSISDANKSIKDMAPQVIRNQYITHDVVQAVKYLNINNIEELNVKMSPKELGEINIKFLKSETENKFIITLSNRDAFALLSENIKEIQNHLNNFDMKMNQVSVEIYSNNQNDFSGNFNKQFNRNNSKDEKKNTLIQKQRFDEEIDSVGEDININLLI